MERRFFLLSMTLLIVAIGLSVALTGVLYFGKTELLSETDFLTVDQQSLRRLNRDEKSVDIVDSYQTSAAFVAQEPTHADLSGQIPTLANNVGVDNNSTVSVDNYCMTPGCINTAALILQNLNQSVDPCNDFYQFACGGFVERTDIPNDRTRMSTFSVLGDELLTQVTFLL